MYPDSEFLGAYETYNYKHQVRTFYNTHNW